MKNLVVIGAGNVGECVCTNVLPEIIENYEQIYFFDNNVEKQGKKFNGYLILSRQELINLSKTEECSFIIATDFWREIYKDCEEMYIEKNVIAIYTGLNFTINRYFRGGYSQDSEDVYLSEKIKNKKRGFYVDIGAHHPYRFSNTYWAYKNGWRGINIDPNIDAIKLFEKERSDDINLNCGIASKSDEINYYMFSEGAFNTFDENEFKGLRQPEKIVKVRVERLDFILKKYNVDHIDFMNIDVEGMEMDVLKSNDWDRFKPDFIAIEQKNLYLDEILETEIYKFLEKLGYKCDYKSIRTAIYVLKKVSDYN